MGNCFVWQRSLVSNHPAVPIHPVLRYCFLFPPYYKRIRAGNKSIKFHWGARVHCDIRAREICGVESPEQAHDSATGLKQPHIKFTAKRAVNFTALLKIIDLT